VSVPYDAPKICFIVNLFLLLPYSVPLAHIFFSYIFQDQNYEITPASVEPFHLVNNNALDNISSDPQLESTNTDLSFTGNIGNHHFCTHIYMLR
jgi:hypothetical protein